MRTEPKRILRIGVLSDTHIPHAARRMPSALLRGLAGVDMILHAGDLACMGVIEALNRIAPTFAVFGNMDPPEVRAELPRTRVVEAGGRRIGLVHGSGAPSGLADRVEAAFCKGGDATVNIVVFGHSHDPCEDWRGDVLRFNPGSPTDRRFTRFRSYGILTLGETIESAVVRLE